MRKQRYEVRDEHGDVHIIADTDPIRACERIAEMHGVTVIAWREDRTPTIRVYAGEEA